ncbi:MAG TPA: sigma 54-interacting transcriptional regulator [Kofleriaceae bacterium]|nr:sigma 54-interacting transcriptional regulator [Kofleriaceae bacterium]
MEDQHTRPKLSPSRKGVARARPFLFLVLEAGRPTGGSARFALDAVDVIELGRGGERAIAHDLDGGVRRLTVRIPDPWMSRAHARITRRGAEFTIADLGSSNGTSVDGAPITSAPLRDGAMIELGHTFFTVRAVPADDHAGDILDAADSSAGLATVLPAFEARLIELVRVAPSAVSIVMRGPSGSGKEVLAGVVHRVSRRAGPLVAINCGAIPDDLVESELFGHRRGAFSGALADKIGIIASADRGTLLLDEIGDLPLAVQPALLRALQERAVRPVGATAPVPVDFRVICATHRDLPGMVARGEFREDLWARLAGFELVLPPLAERREDLGTLVAHLVDRLSPDREITLTPDAARALIRHAWPRNVRELEKVLEAALALAGDAELDVQHLPALITEGVPRSGIHVIPPDETLPPAATPDDDPRRAELVAALRDHAGNVSAVARALGKPRSQIQRWMRRWGLRGD